MFSKLFEQVKNHRLSAGAIFLVVAGMGYWGYGKIFSENDIVRYATAQAQNGTLIVSISGSGQVSAFNQIDVKPKTGGEITAVYAKLGQIVGTGAILAAIDTRDAERAVRDAETALTTAKLELDKILDPPDELTLLQSENSLIQAKESREKAKDNVKKAYDDGFNAIVNAFLNLPGIMSGLDETLFDNTIDRNQDNITWYVNQIDSQNNERDKALRYRDEVYAAYNNARKVYTKNFDDYKASSRASDTQTIESLISQTYDTTKIIADTIKTANNYIDFVQDNMEQRDIPIPFMVSTNQSDIDSYTGTTNSNLSSLLSVKRTIQDSKEAIVSAERIIEEKELSLAKTEKGPDDLDIRAKKVAIQQREDSLLTAKQTLADHYVRAPFSGVIAKVNAKKGDSASAGTAIATLITKQKIAEVSLNEIDVAKIKAGQKVTLAFDAIPDLAITGQVAEVDGVGTVSQGVVTYNVKIGFDTQDDRVKTAMSVSAAIITEAKTDVLLVPNSALKQQNGVSYVEVPDENDTNAALASVSGAIFKNSLRRQEVSTGIANDEFTEILNGLDAGTIVVTRAIQSGLQATQTTSQNSAIRIPGLSGGGGGGFRGGGR